MNEQGGKKVLFERLNVDFRHEDDRGSLTQLVHEGYTQVNIIKSKGGMVRGGHYHKLNCEVFYIVSGSCEVRLTKDGVEERANFSAGDFFQIEPYVGHTFYYLEDSVLIGLYDKGVQLENGEKDIFPIIKD